MKNDDVKHLLPDDFSELPIGERMNYFSANAEKIEEARTVSRAISLDDRDDLKERLSGHSIERTRLQKKKRDFDAEMNKLIKAETAEIDPIIETLRTGVEEVEDTVYWLFDFDKNVAYGFVADGDCVDVRPLTMSERQSHIKPVSMHRLGNN